jgi:hypothetical protein
MPNSDSSPAQQADTDAGKKQMGTIMGKLFGHRNELTIEDFRVAKSEESATTDQGNTQTLRKYRFNLISQPNPPSTSPTQTPGPIPTAPPAQVDRTGIPQNPIKSQ